jgi:hypothetical protein
MCGLRDILRNYFVVEPGGEHVGEKQAAKFDIEGKRGCEKGMIHADSSECIAPRQQFAIDGADLVQELPESLIVGQIFSGLAVIVLGNVIHLRPLSIATEGEIVLGAMTWAASAFAARLAARLVALDKGPTEQTIERWHLLQQLVSAPAQNN